MPHFVDSVLGWGYCKDATTRNNTKNYKERKRDLKNSSSDLWHIDLVQNDQNHNDIDQRHQERIERHDHHFLVVFPVSHLPGDRGRELLAEGGVRLGAHEGLYVLFKLQLRCKLSLFILLLLVSVSDLYICVFKAVDFDVNIG